VTTAQAANSESDGRLAALLATKTALSGVQEALASQQAVVSGESTCRDYAAIQPCAQNNVLCLRDCIDQPITLHENRSTTTVRYSQPSWVLM